MDVVLLIAQKQAEEEEEEQEADAKNALKNELGGLDAEEPDNDPSPAKPQSADEDRVSN